MDSEDNGSGDRLRDAAQGNLGTAEKRNMSSNPELEMLRQRARQAFESMGRQVSGGNDVLALGDVERVQNKMPRRDSSAGGRR